MNNLPDIDYKKSRVLEEFEKSYKKREEEIKMEKYWQDFMLEQFGLKVKVTAKRKD